MLIENYLSQIVLHRFIMIKCLSKFKFLFLRQHDKWQTTEIHDVSFRHGMNDDKQIVLCVNDNVIVVVMAGSNVDVSLFYVLIDEVEKYSCIYHNYDPAAHQTLLWHELRIDHERLVANTTPKICNSSFLWLVSVQLFYNGTC